MSTHDSGPPNPNVYSDGERLSKVERQVAGILNGQAELRDHIDSKIDALMVVVENANNEHPFSAPIWAFVLLAASCAILAAVVVIFLADYYLF